MAERIDRGDIWIYDWPDMGGVLMKGPHLSVVVQTNAANHRDSYQATIILPISSSGYAGGPPHIKISPTAVNGLKHESYVKTEQIYTVLKSRLERKVGRLDDDDLHSVEASMKRVLVLA